MKYTSSSAYGMSMLKRVIVYSCDKHPEAFLKISHSPIYSTESLNRDSPIKIHGNIREKIIE